jgi:hypothetical protein
MTSIERIRQWQQQKFASGASLTFFQGANGVWYVTASRKGAVTFELTGEDADVEQAASKLIEQLKLVGEEVPDTERS